MPLQNWATKNFDLSPHLHLRICAFSVLNMSKCNDFTCDHVLFFQHSKKVLNLVDRTFTPLYAK